ncbi:hypothetical protein Bca52824_096412 [Brassica carinata]|uniref:Alkaline/neutral invertase n=1 Tax=Brassica carinata TaxID=52824 RepID=A0A8X7TGV2_BRACI|nr:hypothetical protein Bca52824_096412 [Brassica carinata]
MQYYWVDIKKINEIYRYNTEEYSADATNKFNIYPEQIPSWLVDWIPNRGGYFIGNLQPAHMDFRFFTLGNLWAVVSSLGSQEQNEGVMALIEEKWDDLVANMPLKICFPALEQEEWRIITGSDPKNTPWSYHNGGSWPTLLWQFTLACIKMGKLDLAKKAVAVAEKRLKEDQWPEYYDTRSGRFVGKQSRLYQTWTIAVAGLLGTITVGANAISYSRFRRRNLRKFRSPINESKEVLADFTSHEHSEGKFFFGLATAPAHAEDDLDDAWIRFAKETPCSAEDEEDKRAMRKKKKVKLAVGAITKGLAKNTRGRKITLLPTEARLKFWSDPDQEVKLAKDTGVTVFRMGIDWCRIMPKEPTNGIKEAQSSFKRDEGDANAFHHSLPPWAADYGGWKMEKTVDYFMDFTRLVVDSMFDLVDSWITFNEPHIFAMLTYMCGSWPGNTLIFWRWLHLLYQWVYSIESCIGWLLLTQRPMTTSTGNPPWKSLW